MKTLRFTVALSLAGLACLTFVGSGLGQATNTSKTFIDYFLPTPITGSLSRDVWGAPAVGPRDPKNGLEDETLKQWCYWDGQIIKAPDGKYHMFASRWDQALGHNGWKVSKAVHAVSDKVTGPYLDKGLCWPDNQDGKGHNVTALVLPDGRYAVVVSDTRPGDVFVSKSLDGPWEQLGKIKGQGLAATNISILVRPDGDYMIVPRSGKVFISKAADGILGPYTAQGPSVFPEGIPNLEDPVIFYSGGLYHIVVNSWSTRNAYHLTSQDGKSNWINRGLAYDPTKDIVRYTDGTVNHWEKLERPGVLIENGHVTAVTLAALDVPKNQEKGNDNHGSKIIVIPFDGAALDRDLQNAAGTYSNATASPSPSATPPQTAPLMPPAAASPSRSAAPPRPAPLTPPAPATPRINGPSVFGVRPGSPFLYSIPATGERPMTFAVEGLPAGLTLDSATGRITGSLAKAGEYPVTLVARNARGENKRPFRIVVGEQIALTPPMGWNSWNCWHGDVTQDAVLCAAKAMVAAGLDRHGWTYVNIDDAWQGVRGGPFNGIQPNKKFPDMKSLADQIHALGLKFGIYSGPWLTSYAGYIGSSCDNEDGTYDWIVAGNHNEFMRIGKDKGMSGSEKKSLLRHGKFPFFKQDARQWASRGACRPRPPPRGASRAVRLRPAQTL